MPLENGGYSMKKFISFLLASFLLISFIPSACASTKDNVFFTLSGYGVIDADAPKDDTVSRGEFARIASRLLGFRLDTDGESTSSYMDVPSTHEYAKEIVLLTRMGILNGVSESLFSPDSALTYEQAIKVLIVITGYGDIAQRNGGWPGGYVATAGRNGMLGGVSLENPFKREDLYRLLYNTLDVSLVDEKLVTNGNETLVKTDDTLKERLESTAGDRLFKHTGVISANAYSYTTTPYSDLYDDEVVIENRTLGKTLIYKVGKTDVFDLVGCEVEFFAREIDGTYELLSVRLKDEHKEKIVTVNAKDLDPKSGNFITYKDENGKGEKLSLDSSIKVVYNGSRVLSPGDNIFDFDDGYVIFINNDSDSSYDLALIWHYVNAIAVKFDGERFDFVNDAQYEKRPSLFVDKTDKNTKMIVTDKNGNKVEPFEGEKTLSIFADKSKSRYRVIVSDEVIEGTFSGIGDETYSVNENEYFGAATLGKDIVLGENYLIYVNHDGKLAFKKPKEVINYAYILKYGSKGNFSRTVSAKMLLGGGVNDGVEINEEDTTDTSSAKYLILQNGGVEIFEFCDDVICNKKKYSGDSLLTLLSSPDMKAVSYVLDEEGKIKEITPLEKYAGSLEERYQYNVNDKVFGGTSVTKDSGFALNSATKAVCVPADDKNNILTEASDDDLAMRVNITLANNDIGYRVEGYDYDEATKKVRFMVTLANMDASYAPDVDVFSERASIVTGVRFVNNPETGETEQCIELLKGSEEISIKPIRLSSSNKGISNLKFGDLIVYNTNNNDLMENVFVIQSISKLSDEFVSEAVSTSIKRTFGRTGNISYDEVDTYNRRLVTKIEVYVGDAQSPRTFTLPQTNTPPIYIYNSGEKSIKASSLQEIRTDGEKIYIFERKGDALVRAIVLVR